MTEKELARLTEVGELKKELRGMDNFATSIRTALTVVQTQAAALAEAVKSAFMETGGIEGVTVINAEAALRACKLADAVLA